VAARGARQLARGLKHAPQVEWLELSEGFHIIPRDRGLPIVTEKIVAFLKQVPIESSAGS